MAIPPLEELLILALLLLGVVGVYLLLKLHYHFAFGLMKHTASYEKNKFKIEKAKKYLFIVLKILLWFGLIGMSVFCVYYLYEGMSLKALVFELWKMIPEGFWLKVLFVLVRIAVIITLSRYLLKFVYSFLDKHQEYSIQNRCINCREETITRVYQRIHDIVKYTVLLGIFYRITLFFPFLEIISTSIGIFLICFVIISLGLLGRNIWIMKNEERGLSE